MGFALAFPSLSTPQRKRLMMMFPLGCPFCAKDASNGYTTLLIQTFIHITSVNSSASENNVDSMVLNKRLRHKNFFQKKFCGFRKQLNFNFTKYLCKLMLPLFLRMHRCAVWMERMTWMNVYVFMPTFWKILIWTIAESQLVQFLL